MVGTAIGAYSNIKNDGVGKGVTETAGGLSAATPRAASRQPVARRSP